MTMSTTFPELEPPHFQFPRADAKEPLSLVLYRGPITGRWFDVSYTTSRKLPSGEWESEEVTEAQDDAAGFGRISFELSPVPHLSWFFRCFDGPLSSEWPAFVPPAALSAHFASRAGPNPLSDLVPPPARLIGERTLTESYRFGPSDEELDEIRFYLVNFQLVFLPDHTERSAKVDKWSLLRLNADDWRIDIERRHDFMDSLSHHLEDRHGYAITHHGRVWRERQGACIRFTFEEAETILEATELFTSFVRGGRVALALPVGYKDGQSVVEDWRIGSADRGYRPEPRAKGQQLPGWYPVYRHPAYQPPQVPGRLATLFVQFAAKWLDPNAGTRRFWQRMFRELVLTYTDANRTVAPRVIVPAATALETLTWAVLVVQEQRLAGDKHPAAGRPKYENLAADERLRRLLTWAGLPTRAHSAAISPKPQHMLTEDNPKFITWTRNRVVHPDKQDQLSGGLAAKVGLVAQWYVELLLLKLLDYDGYYRNKLDGQKIEPVPWGTP